MSLLSLRCPEPCGFRVENLLIIYYYFNDVWGF
jgi:hypothetical protein